MRFRVDRTRMFQIGLIGLLVVCAVQVMYWIVDESRYTAIVGQRWKEMNEREAKGANDMLRAGLPSEEIAALYPELSYAERESRFVVDPGAAADLESERYHRLNRYGWEGGFFLLVIMIGMAVLARTLRQEARLRRRQESFLASVSHEFKTPLATMRLSAETIALRDPPTDKRRRLIARLLDELGRLEAMVGNILDTARIEEGQILLEPQLVDLRPMVENARRRFEERARTRGIRLEVEIARDALIRADPLIVQAVIDNLIDNALKATSAGVMNAETQIGKTVGVDAAATDDAGAQGEGRLDSPWVRVEGKREGGLVRLAVSDNGVGFAVEDGRRLFEKFHQLEPRAPRRGGGSGLGLYLVRRLVEMEGGKVTGHSDGRDLGATFVVSWPVAGEDR